MVFGKVLDEESMRIIKLIESKGSASGSPSAKVVIADSGELNLEDVQDSLPKETA